jgi:hypothetical protein
MKSGPPSMHQEHGKSTRVVFSSTRKVQVGDTSSSPMPS